jgi:1-deoxy-D-xylulose-5-phosphate synthase
MDEILPFINSPDDLKNLDIPALAQVAKEIRQYIVSTVCETGGHLAPSLGVVELTLVLHHVYNTPSDKIVWDVGHQAYAHKIITGRRDQFRTIRQHGGISGFPKTNESPYDAFGAGHASTAISAAFGMACARDLSGENHKIVTVVGDGALTGGLAYEGLNNAGASGRDLVVVLNDNSMSISPNVGAISKYLTNVIANPLYNKIKNEIWDITGKFSTMGPRIRWAARRMEEGLKSFVMPGLLFERLGFRYFGPIDGHNIAALLHIFREVKSLKGPILVHVLTKKGKGYKPAEENASIFHGLGKFDPDTGQPISTGNIPTYTKIFGDTVVEMAKKDQAIVTITAAMALGTGLSAFAQQFPNRFFDVGIAEEHAVTFAAGLAIQGYRPIVAIYSSFLQRSYDQIIHDVALQNLPVIFAIDRAGLVGDDGPTHHGTFDLAFLRTIPNMVIMAPKDEEELRHTLWTALQYHDGPVAIRYPRGCGEGVVLTENFQTLPIGESEVVQHGTGVAILGIGPVVHKAIAAAETLSREDGLSPEIINARFVKPVDRNMLDRIASQFKLIITLEEGIIKGGFGSEVAEYYAERKKHIELIRCGIPDRFVDQGDKKILLDDLGLSAQGIVKTVRSSEAYQDLVKGRRFKELFKIGRQPKFA